MTTTTHTISINENPRICNGTVSSKRVSKSRTYGACVVATATEKTVADIALGLADHEAQIAARTPALESVLNANGYESVEGFEAAHKAALDAWYGPRHEARMKRSREREIETGKRMYFLTDAEGAEVEAALEASGLVNPYGAVMGPLAKLVSALKGHQYAVARIKKQNVQAGDQIVVTWCRDSGLAQKALGSRDVKHYTARFYTVAVRTDIEVKAK